MIFSSASAGASAAAAAAASPGAERRCAGGGKAGYCQEQRREHDAIVRAIIDDFRPEKLQHINYEQIILKILTGACRMTPGVFTCDQARNFDLSADAAPGADVNAAEADSFSPVSSPAKRATGGYRRLFRTAGPLGENGPSSASSSWASSSPPCSAPASADCPAASASKPKRARGRPPKLRRVGDSSSDAWASPAARGASRVAPSGGPQGEAPGGGPAAGVGARGGARARAAAGRAGSRSPPTSGSESGGAGNVESEVQAAPRRAHLAAGGGRCWRCEVSETPQWRYIHRGRYCNACYMRAKRWVDAHLPGKRLPPRVKVDCSAEEDELMSNMAKEMISAAFDGLE